MLSRATLPSPMPLIHAPGLLPADSNRRDSVSPSTQAQNFLLTQQSELLLLCNQGHLPLHAAFLLPVLS